MTSKPSYELTTESRNSENGNSVYRIRATRDIANSSVKEGDLGGWVSSAELSDGRPRISGDAWVFGEAELTGNARASGRAWIYGTARVYGDAHVSGNAWVFGDSRIFGSARISGGAWVYGAASVTGSTEIDEHARVHGDARINGSPEIDGNAEVCGEARVFDDPYISGHSKISGFARVYGNAEISRDAQISGNADIAETTHYLVVGPLGPELQQATLTRQRDGAHRIDFDWHGLDFIEGEEEPPSASWHGTLETLLTEVSRWRARWPGNEAEKDEWMEQYRALLLIGKATATRWERRDGSS